MHRSTMLAPAIAFVAALAATTVDGVAQARWTQHAPTIAPAPRSGATGAPANLDLYLFGGELAGGGLSDETWRFDGSNWFRLPRLGPAPPARARHALTWDPGRGRLVLFGGRDQTSSVLDDTWEFDGSRWQQLQTSVAPSARSDATMAYDLTRQACILFGGDDGQLPTGSGVNDETWAWDGVNWTQLTPPVRPPARSGAAMTTADGQRRIVLFGGFASGVLGDTWIWEADTWRQVTTATIPQVRGSMTVGLTAAGLSDDLLRDRMVLFGGTDGSSFNDSTWEFDGTDWRDRGPTPGLTGRTHPTIGRCGLDLATILFGGRSAATLGDTWSYQTPVLPRVLHQESGCANPSGEPALESTVPWLGDPLEIGVHHAPPGSLNWLMFGVGTAAVSLAPIGFPGCTLWLDPFVALPMTVDPRSGRPSIALSTPLDPSLAGGILHIQALLLVPTPPLGISVSDHVELRFAAR